jgi:GPH family glycoside/pentoside/hexuronide:cation symporter
MWGMTDDVVNTADESSLAIVAAHLPLRTKISYGISTFGSGLFDFSLTLYLFYFYTDVVHVAPATVGTFLLIAIIVNAMTDIPMGWLSDHTRTRWGRRRPYILFGAVPCGLSFFLLFDPPANHPALHLLLMATAVYCSLTVYLVPYNGLGAEITLDHHERTSLMAYRQVCYILGLIGGVGTKWLTGLFGSERTGFAFAGAACAVVMVITMLITFVGTRERPEFSEPRPNAPRLRFGQVLRNRPFLIMLITYIIYNVSILIPVAVGVQVTKHWLHAEEYFPFAVLAFLVCGVSAVPMWTLISRRFDKRAALISAFLTAAAFTLPMALLSPDRAWLLFVLMGGMGLGFGGFMTLPLSIVGDTIDYDEYHTGHRRESLYWGIAEFCRKVSQGGAYGLIGATLQYLGYEGQAAEQTDAALWGLKILFVGVPVVLFTLAAAIFRAYPLTKQVHDMIHREMGRLRGPEPANDHVAN